MDPPETALLPAPRPPAKGDEKWKVDAPGQDQPWKLRTVPLDVDEGTWMSLDVSPDGEEIVFDLLGDIYVMPVTGGEAKPLTEGLAWDMQPTFSPDGRSIAFTSDRGGGDNIWVMRADGSEPRPVTKESFRLLNSPAWTPDGQYIVARKHFTKRRSLGAGEMWLYHHSGGKGVQMTKKDNDQKDTGEPAFSPDGRYLYYSQDTTPGAFFEYNKDPHAGIYEIERLDLERQRTETFVSGIGGAVRPTPSPDGTQLAFVKRAGLKTALFTMDVASGKTRMLTDALDRDMQETWAIHGVYPRMDWTPDGGAIVYWAGGKLHRVDTSTGAVTDIPFEVKHERAVAEPARFAVDVHPDRFDTKLLRWLDVSADGKRIVYQALGHIYVRDLPDGQPRRLTRDDDVFEHYPALSRDGNFVVYTTWNDETLGEVRIAPIRGGRSRAVSTERGHYVEPTFSPDGARVVYRKVDGGGLRSRLWSRDRGLYVVSVGPRRTGAATLTGPELLSRSGHSPHFGADPDRVYLIDGVGEGDDRQQGLRSIGLTDRKERTHVRSKWATEFRVSPDGRWFAFRERFHAYVAPFPAVGRTFDIGPKAEGLPVARVTRDAGEYLRWSGDSTKLHWLLGPELFTRPLAESFAFLRTGDDAGSIPEPAPEPASTADDDPADEATADGPPPPATGINVGFSIASDVPEGSIALVGGKVVTMKGDEVIDDGVVVVQGNRIAAVGSRSTTKVPDGARVFDVSGHTVIPGLVDVHAHGPHGSDGIIPQQSWLDLSELSFGVTTIHDPSNDSATIFAAAELARAGMITAPRIFSTGTILYGAETGFTAVVDSLEDARTHLRRMKALGAISVKSYNQPRRDQRQQILQAARELEMMVVPEGGSLFQHNMTFVADGHTGVEHAIPVANAYADVEQFWGSTYVGYTPTLVVGYGGLWGENYWYFESDVFDNPRLRAFVPPFAFEGRARRRTKASEGDWNHIRIAKLCKQLLDAGVHVQLGAHGQREGLAAHWELWMFQQGGMTNLEALRAATLDGARYLGLDGDIGSVEPGKLADLAVIEGDVLADLRRSEHVVYTVLNGRVYDAATLDQLAPASTKRPPLFWERDGVDGTSAGGSAHAAHED